ncbi:MAG: hypothetical protein V1767_00680 [Chloroflexota bacterium]
MSLYDYKEGIRISLRDSSFYGLIQAAMRQADSENIEKLKRAFPETWEELQARYNAPGGILPGDGTGRK